MYCAGNNWEDPCPQRPQPPHKKVREGIRDTNLSPLTARKICLLALGRWGQRPSQLTPLSTIFLSAHNNLLVRTHSAPKGDFLTLFK